MKFTIRYFNCKIIYFLLISSNLNDQKLSVDKPSKTIAVDVFDTTDSVEIDDTDRGCGDLLLIAIVGKGDSSIEKLLNCDSTNSSL